MYNDIYILLNYLKSKKFLVVDIRDYSVKYNINKKIYTLDLNWVSLKKLNESTYLDN